jgi:hypothetical protein
VKNKFKILLTDVAGVSLIIIAPFLGWLPGPGGIPLLIAGLALLAINNEWAEKLLQAVKEKGNDLAKVLFPQKKIYSNVHDLVSVTLMVVAIILLITRPNQILVLVSISLLILSLTEFLYNRERGSRLKTKIHKLFKKHY